MTSKLSRLILIFIVAFAVSGCSAWKKGKPLPVEKSPIIDDGPMTVPKVNTFLTILDASSSMDKVPGIYNKFDVARNILDRMNQMLPEYPMTAGLRSFGHHPDLSGNRTVLFYGMDRYNTRAFGRALADIRPAGGISPLEDAFKAAAGDLGDRPGKTALILVSDAKDMSRRVLPAARELATAYKDTLCIYPVLIGNDPQGHELMTRIASLTGCGVVTRADRLIDNDGLEQFVKMVFLGKEADAAAAAPQDADGDGVVDDRDQCPKTPAGISVNSRGCGPKVLTADTDGDGIPDTVDQCPGTPEGAKVGPNGCWNAGDVFFGFDKSRIGPQGKTELAKVVEILNRTPVLRVKLQGHTCDIGSKAYNLGLSKRRADAVKAFLVQAGIAADRLETEGVGFAQPLVPNTSPENRALNRRTEIHPLN